MCQDHEQQEWHDTWKIYNGTPRQDRAGQRQEPQSSSQSVTGTIKTIGVLEISGKVNQKNMPIIIDTGACVSCIDQNLLRHSKATIRPVGGVNMKTATDEPVQIVGRTDITLEICNCVLRFPVFVAKGVSDCCILGNDFHLKFKTEINFATRTVQLVNTSGRKITTEFHSQEKDAKYLRPPPDPTWLNQIQLEEVPQSRARVISADRYEVPPRSYRLLKIKLEGSIPCLGIMEPEPGIFKEKSMILPYGLVKDPTPKEVLMVNLTKETKYVDKGQFLAEVHEVHEVWEDERLMKLGQADKKAQGVYFDESKLNINPKLIEEDRDKLVALLKEYKDRFAWDKGQMGRTEVCEMTIPLVDDTPVHQPPYRVSHKEREIINKQVAEMLERGVIRESNSAYASPVVLVRKKNDEWRFCVDYRMLNKNLADITWPLPLIGDILTYLNGCQWFTSLDMNSGYWQIPIKEDDRHKTAFITPDGCWEFNTMPFGLKTSPAIFQRCMDRVLAGLKWGHCLLYLDDVLVMAPDFQEMLQRLKKVLDRLRGASMTLNPAKCTFGYNEVSVLGHVVSARGISPNPDKISAVRNFQPPRRLRALRSFLGLCNYYRAFVPGFSKTAGPLIQLTKKNVRFHWGEEQEHAFQELKERLVTAPILRHFDPKLPLELHTDASQDGVGATLMHPEGETTLPVAYASRRLSQAELKYTTTEKECIAVVWATKHFRQFLWGRKFTIVVDHHALCWLDKNKDVSGRLGRWALKLMEFEYTIRHKQGKLHVVPDCLSRNCSEGNHQEEEEEMTNEIPMLKVTIQNLGELQDEDEECKRIKEAVLNPENATSADRRLARSYLIVDNVLYRKNIAHSGSPKLLVVPKSMRQEILFECHDSPLTGGHLGFSKTFFKIKNRYYWPNMLKETESYVKTCMDCQTRKTPRQAPVGLLQPIPVGHMFDRIGIDVLGPFTRTSRGKSYIIVAMDYATKWAEAEATRSATAEDVARFLINKIICKFGCVREILSDRGTNFKSSLVSALMNGLGIRTSYTTAYHPMCNGLVEHFNGTLAQMLSYYVSTNQRDWDLYVNLTCFSYNTSRHETTKHTPFFLLYGREARLPSEVTLGQDTCEDGDAEAILQRVQRCRREAATFIVTSQKKQKERYDKSHRHVEYRVQDKVMVWTPVRKKGKSTKLLHRWHGPYVINKKVSDVNYEVEIIPRGNKMPYFDTIHVCRLKPYHERQSNQ